MMGWGKAISQLGNPIVLISLLIGVILLAGFLFWMHYRDKRRKKENPLNPAEIIDNKPVETNNDVPPTIDSADASQSAATVSTEGPKGVPGSINNPKTPQYAAMVFTDEGIKFKSISKKLSSLIYCDPSMPKPGMKYLAVEKNGDFQSFDPREAPIASSDTPQRAWRATHVYELVKAVWTTPAGFLEKLNMIFFWVFCGGLFIIVIEIISKIGGK
jgi:hypothetical protein